MAYKIDFSQEAVSKMLANAAATATGQVGVWEIKYRWDTEAHNLIEASAEFIGEKRG